MPRKKTEAAEETVDAFEIKDSITDIEMSSIEDSIDCTDPRWTDFILNDLEESEKYDDNPKADGLRRMVEKHIGPILGINTELKSWPSNGDNNGANSATAVAQITVWDNKLGREIFMTGVADANEQSCVPPYNKFLSSIAETRAEGRAYRKILRLQNVVTSDEMPLGAKNEADRIQDSQIDLINKFCQELDINVRKLIDSGNGKALTKIRNCTKENAMKILQRLHDAEHAKANGKKVNIPDDLKGYEKDWREYFG